jgi:hypothetical protein
VGWGNGTDADADAEWPAAAKLACLVLVEGGREATSVRVSEVGPFGLTPLRRAAGQGGDRRFLWARNPARDGAGLAGESEGLMYWDHKDNQS